MFPVTLAHFARHKPHQGGSNKHISRSLNVVLEQGLKCGVFAEMLSVGLGFWGYELGQSIFRGLNDGQSPGPQQRGIIGGISALVILTATMPIEVVLRRLQVRAIVIPNLNRHLQAVWALCLIVYFPACQYLGSVWQAKKLCATSSKRLSTSHGLRRVHSHRDEDKLDPQAVCLL